MIGKSKAAYFIGETLIKPEALTMVKAVCGKEATKKLTTVPLSNDTVQRRIVDMSNEIKDQIAIKLKESKFFSLLLDESTDVARFSQLRVLDIYSVVTATFSASRLYVKIAASC